MNSPSEFTIDKVGWHTSVENNPESCEEIHARFKTVITFLQDNCLTIRTILPAGEAITDETRIRSSDLTTEGLQLMKASYDKWLQQLDAGASPVDVVLFQKKLTAMRKRSQR